MPVYYEEQPSHSFNRAPQHHDPNASIAGEGGWIYNSHPTSQHSSPGPPHDRYPYALSMSHSFSGPGMAIDDPAIGLGIVRFDGHLQFGEHEAISLEEARRRTLEHEQRLRDRGAKFAKSAELRQSMREMDEERERLRRGGEERVDGGGVDYGTARERETERETPYPDVNLMPTDTDPNALQQMVRQQLRRGLSTPEGEEVTVGWR